MEVGCGIFSVFGKKRLKADTHFCNVTKIFWFVSILGNIILHEQNGFFVVKTNTVVYCYDHLMISVIVLIETVFIVFNHANNKKVLLKFFRREGEMFEF